MCTCAQVVEYALQQLVVNFKNHVVLLVPVKTTAWLRERLRQRRQDAQPLWYSLVPGAVHGALLRTVLQACTWQADTPLAEMIQGPRGDARLKQHPLPHAEMAFWQQVVHEVRGAISPDPATAANIKANPCRYLPWLFRWEIAS